VAQLADPGWKKALRRFLTFGISRDTEKNGLTEVRAIFAAFFGATVLIAVVASLTVSGPAVNVGRWSLITIAVGVVGGVASVWFFNKPLPCDDKIATAYVKRLYEWWSLPAMVGTGAGFVGALMSQSPIPPVLAFGLLVVPAVLAAPTVAGLRRDQARLDQAGCQQDLAAELQVGWPGSR